MIETVALAQAVQATTVGPVARPPAVADPDAVARFAELMAAAPPVAPDRGAGHAGGQAGDHDG